MKKLFLAFLILVFTAYYSFARSGGGSAGGSGGGMENGAMGGAGGGTVQGNQSHAH